MGSQQASPTGMTQLPSNRCTLRCSRLAADKARAAHLAEGLPLLNVQPGGKQFHAVPDDVTVERKSLSWSYLLQ